MRKLIVACAAICSLTAPAALAESALPDKIALPNGFAPEGIEIAGGKTFFVGSTQTGAIYSGKPAHGRWAASSIPGAAAGTRAATGIEYEHGKLWVAGAAGGTARVYDVKTHALVREYHLAPASSTFINDAVVTKNAAFFTDSQRPVISAHRHRPRRRAGRPSPTSRSRATTTTSRVSSISTGSCATADGKHLIAVSTAGRKLFLINPATGAAKTIVTGVLRPRQRRRPDARRKAALRRPEPART